MSNDWSYYFSGLESCPWYLRVPGYEVLDSGYQLAWRSNVTEDGEILSWVQGINTDPGIRPAMWINCDTSQSVETADKAVEDAIYHTGMGNVRYENYAEFMI